MFHSTFGFNSKKELSLQYRFYPRDIAKLKNMEVQHNEHSSDAQRSYSYMLLWLERNPREFLDCLTVVFHRVTELVVQKELCACHVLELVRLVSRAIIDLYAAYKKKKMIERMTYLGVLTLELVGTMACRYRLEVAGKWERVAFAAVSFVNLWMPGVFDPEPARALPMMIKHWVVLVSYHSFMCPNPLLRLELLRFVAMFDVMDFDDVSLRHTVILGFLQNALHLSVSRLLPVGRAGLLCVLRKMLYKLHSFCLLGRLMVRSCTEIENMRVRHAERVFAYLVMLMGQAAQRLRWMRCKKKKSPLNTIAEFSDILQILWLLTAIPPNLQLFEMPGMCQVAGGAIATTIRSIVLTPVDPAVKNPFQRLLSTVDDYFFSLCTYQIQGTLLDDLQRHHGRDLSLLAVKMREYGYQPKNVPQPKSLSHVPVEFMDDKTKRLMTCPVRLEATGKVVDYTTLLRLMLLETDADTGRPLDDLAYTPLRDLRNQIRAWEILQSISGDGSSNSVTEDRATQTEHQQEHNEDAIQGCAW